MINAYVARTTVTFLAFLVLIAALTAQVDAGNMVRWSGQIADAKSSLQPQGVLLNPSADMAYWGPAINCGARLTTSTNSRVQVISFDTPVELNEITLHIQGEGDVQVMRIVGATGDGSTSPEDAAEKFEPNEILPMSKSGESWLRIRLKAESGKEWKITWPEGVTIKNTLLWGKGESLPVEPIYPVRKKFAVAFDTLPGADKTTVSDHIYWSWQRPLIANENMKAEGAVWAQHNKWKRISAAPVLPAHDTLNKPVNVVMARNEYEGVLLTLTSLRDTVGKPIHDSGIYKKFVPGFQEFTVTTSNIRGPTPDKVRLTLRVAATLRSQLFGTVTGPLFSVDDMIGTYHMLRYFTNGRLIADYPRVALPPCASHVFWLEVQTVDAAPGTYRATLNASPGPSVPVEIEVLPVTLPSPRVWVYTWQFGAVGTSWPFASTEVLENTVRDKISRGVSCFRGVPTPHTEAAEARRQKPDVYFFYNYLVPDRWVVQGYGGNAEAFENLTAEHEQQIRDHVLDVIRQYRKAGVDYESWSGEFWDEPADKGAPLIKKSAEWVKAIDPKANVYSNPVFTDDIENFRMMSDVSDMFVPFWGLWFDGLEWQKEIRPGRINAFYGVQGSNRSELHEELVGHYRIMSWHAFKLGLQGWGFYSYYGPMGDPYTDYEPAGAATDYMVMYPGPRGPVPSRQAEAMRDGWEDYRLLTLLDEKQSSRARQAIEDALSQIPLGREPLTAGVDFEAIRLKLLHAAALVGSSQ